MPRSSRRVVSGRNRPAWNKRLDDLFRAIVMTKHGAARMPNVREDGWFWYGACLRCLSVGTLYVSHIEPKGEHPHLRWTEGNAFPFCSRCHMHWWHKHPREAQEFRDAKLGAFSATLAMRAKSRGGRMDLKLIEVAMVQELRRLAPRGIEGLVY